ncbi:MAG: ankyrin repeat domain-containing protein [Coxiellaceae bacterium]|nr:ankyrin repeat domain-containing protein [Coxiellaceae bacterium]
MRVGEAESAAIANITNYAEATMNTDACKSVGLVLLELQQVYLNQATDAEKEAVIAQAMRDYEAYVTTIGQQALTDAWLDLKGYMEGRTNALDRITDREGNSVYIRVKTVFALVYMATVDNSVYAGSEDLEKADRDKHDRLHTLSEAIKTIHQGAARTFRCHLGVRNDLVGVLNNVYPGVRLIEDIDTYLLYHLKAEVIRVLDTSAELHNDIIYLAWIRDGEMPEALRSKLMGTELGLIAINLTRACKAAGIAESETLKDKILQYVSAEYLTYLSPPIESDGGLHSLAAFHAEGPARQMIRAHERMDAWIVTDWKNNAACADTVRDFVLVNRSLHGLNLHESALHCWNEDELSHTTIDAVKAICARYVAGDPLRSSLVAEERLLLDDAFIVKVKRYERDSRFGLITNFFGRFFSSLSADKKKMQLLLLDKAFQSKILVDDDTIKQWIDLSAGEQHLTPYQINRILLSAIIIDPAKWTEDFYVRLQYTYDFIQSYFSGEHTARTENLRQSSYPEVLLDQINASIALYKETHGMEAEVELVDDSSLPFKMPYMLETLDDYFDYMKQLGVESSPDMLDHALMRHLFTGLSLQDKKNQLKRMIDEDNTVWLDTLLSFMPASEYDLSDLHGELLIYAAYMGKLESTKLLLAKDEVDVNKINRNDQTALMCAAEKGYTRIVKKLLKKPGVIVDQVAWDQKTALVYAVIQGELESARLLIERGHADVNKVTYSGPSVLELAVRDGDMPMLSLLFAQESLEVNRVGRHGRTAFFAAVMNNKVEVVQFMLSDNRVDINQTDMIEESPLIYAAKIENREVVNLLLASGRADISQVDYEGRTLLMHAAKFGWNDIVERLLASNTIDIDHVDSAGWTAHRLAGVNGHAGICDALTTAQQAQQASRGRHRLFASRRPSAASAAASGVSDQSESKRCTIQ